VPNEVIVMDDPRCKVAAIEAEDARCKSLLSGMAIEVEDYRCESLHYSASMEMEDPRCRQSASEMDDPRCRYFSRGR
jgi:predicted metal-binding protein